MAAPVYTQSQAQSMIEMQKVVPHDAWENRFEGRPSTTQEIRNRIRVVPEEEANLTEFIVETCLCPGRGEAAFTLLGKLLGYTEQPLCRYEVQISRHTNPRWFPPFVIAPRALHRHVYNERAIREDWPWDKCAELLKQPKRKLSLQQAIDILTPIFINDVRLEIHDPDVLGHLFDGRHR